MNIIRNHRRILLRLLLGISAPLLAIPATAQSTDPEVPPQPSYRPVYPLKLSENHRYLVDQNNQPFLMVGDTPQGLMGRLTERDAEKYFVDREAHDFNTAGWIDVAWAGRAPVLPLVESVGVAQ